MKITCDKSNPLLAGLIALEEAELGTTPLWGNENSWLDDSNQKIVIESNNDFLRLVGRSSDLYCHETPELQTQVNHWLTFTIGPLVDDFEKSLKHLDKYLAPRTYLVSNKLSIADIAVFSFLNGSKKWNGFVSDKQASTNILRWYKFIQAKPSVQNVLNSLPDEAKVALAAQSQKDSSVRKANSKERNESGKERRRETQRPKTEGGRAQEGKFVDLPGAEMGKVLVRFPPEASGYLHIGHAKAALLNQYYQQAFDGQLIMRFDDTNPAKENVEFEKVILEDVELLQIKPNRFTYTSDYFELFLKLCVQMLKEDKAYVDDTDPETMKTEREQRIESANRSNSVEQNLKLWEEMKKGTDIGQKCCVRAKIDMKSPNGCLRDPTIYRCKNEPHPRTGDKYKVYPTYDFACPIVDSIEGVTHTLRTMEYHDRDPQFYWFIEALGLRKPHIWEYSRLAMTNTVLSKRKLTWFVENGFVEGWDDPRMPTVRGILRRGMTVQGLKEFIIAQGSSRSVVVMEWDKIWAFNKKVIDPIAPRFTAVSFDDTVTVEIRGVKEQSLTVPLHPKNSEVGTKDVWISDKVLIDRKDAELLKDGQNATFINWGNIRIKKIHKMKKDITKIEAETNLDDKDYKNTPKLTWLAVLEQNREVRHTPVWCVYYDNLIRKPVLAKDDDFKNYLGHKTEMWVRYWGDPAMKTLKKGDIIQLQRIGFFRVDHPWEPRNLATGKEQEIVLFYIPDGHTKETPLTLENKEKYGAGPSSNDIQSNVHADQQGNNTSKAAELSDQIVKHTETIKKLQAEKAAESVIEVPANILKLLKDEFKKETNTEWTPECAAKYQICVAPKEKPKKPEIAKAQQKPAQVTTTVSSKSASAISDDITKQGDLVRKLKGDKAPKPDVEAAVKVLLGLKAEYKTVTNTEWKPGCVPPATKVEPSSSSKSATSVNEEIVKQGEFVRKLKADKAAKPDVETAVKVLLGLKAEYKALTNTEWKPGCVPPTEEVKPPLSSSKSATSVNADIVKQGELVRKLKADKAAKPDVEAAVKVLLSLKSEYKALTNTEWKPGCVPPTEEVRPPSSSSKSATSVNDEIVKQGELVRKLKAEKAAKPDVEAAVKVLLSLKSEYKALTNTEWKPGCVPPTGEVKPPSSSSKSATSVNDEIVKQGELVRKLKAEKAAKPDVEAAVKILLGLKAEYKALTNTEWKPGCVPPVEEALAQSSQVESSVKSALSVNDEIVKQGDLVRKLKADKATKPDVEAAVKVLLALKTEYKALTNQDWKPGCVPPMEGSQVCPKPSGARSASSVNDEVVKQGDLVRKLKGDKAPKPDIEAAVKVLLGLKEEYKKVTNQDWKPGCVPPGEATAEAQPSNPAATKKLTNSEAPAGGAAQIRSGAAKASSPAPAAKAAKATKPAKAKPEPRKADEGSSVKKQTRLGLEATKEDNLADWYSQVITKGELIEYYDVSGCYIIRPWAFAIWKAIKDWFDAEIKKLGVEDCYFPMFVSKAALEKEKSHIADFSPEVAWVTKSGDSDMAEPIAVRPTSETVMYPAYAKWIQSYRDLPIKLNQWNNVVRWEFKHPQPFLRTREFLWQEGHTAYANEEEACAEVAQILELYAKIYNDLLAIPVVRGRKTGKEKFAGGDYTCTVEAFISASGRAIQGATSHHLGQNFSKMFEIVYEDPETQEKKYVYQNSWGLTTRTIGVLVMVHADNQGLVLPPRVARYQVVIVPCGITVNLKEEARNRLQTSCDDLEKELCAAGVRVKGDYRQNYSPGWKFNHWELKGVPIRVELGPKDLENGTLIAVSRDDGSKVSIPRNGAVKKLQEMLETIQARLLQKATDELTSHIVTIKNWEEFLPSLDKKNIILAPFCGDMDCEGNIKTDSTREEAEPGAPAMGAKSLCIPTDQPAPITATDKCIHPACQRKPLFYTLFGRSY